MAKYRNSFRICFVFFFLRLFHCGRGPFHFSSPFFALSILFRFFFFISVFVFVLLSLGPLLTDARRVLCILQCTQKRALVHRPRYTVYSTTFMCVLWWHFYSTRALETHARHQRRWRNCRRGCERTGGAAHRRSPSAPPGRISRSHDRSLQFSVNVDRPFLRVMSRGEWVGSLS